MITFKANTQKLGKALAALQAKAGVSTSQFLRTEGRLLSEELAKGFTPKQAKSAKSIQIDRRVAYRIGKNGSASIPWSRLQQVINRRRPVGNKPTVQATVAQPAMRAAVKALGKLAAGWVGKGNKLGARRVKAFVMSHVGDCQGDVTTRLYGLRQYVRLRNFTPYLQNMRGKVFVVKRALNRRTGAMRSNLRLITAGIKKYWDGK